MMEPVFWMVYVEGMSAPKKKHMTFVSAENEACRLAKANNCIAYVLQAIQGYRPVNVEKFDLNPQPDYFEEDVY